MPGLDESAGLAGTSATGTWGFIFNEAAVYDPEIQGPIERINFSWDSRYTPTATPIAGDGTFEDLAFVASSLAVRQYDEVQDRELYWMVFARREFVRRANHPDWTGFSIMNISAGDYLRFPAGVPGQATQPDFTKPLTFGYVQGTSCGNQCRTEGRTYFGRAEIDNWQVVINPEEGIRFSQDEYVVREDAGEFELTIWRIGEVSEQASVLLSTEDGTAVAGLEGQGDYDAISDMLVVFEPGQSVVKVPLIVHDRDIFTLSVTFTVRLHNVSGAELGDPVVATVRINDKTTGGFCDIGFDQNADAGADLCVAVVSSGKVSSNDQLPFAGLTPGFTELANQNRLEDMVINNLGPESVSDFTVEVRIPKENLAGFGLRNNNVKQDLDSYTIECAIPAGVNDPQYVIMRCEVEYKQGQSLQPGQSVTLMAAGAGGVDQHRFYFGYAATVSGSMTVTIEAEAIASVPADTNMLNNIGSVTILANPGGDVDAGGGGGGALSVWFFVLIVTGLLLRAQRTYRQEQAADDCAPLIARRQNSNSRPPM